MSKKQDRISTKCTKKPYNSKMDQLSISTPIIKEKRCQAGMDSSYKSIDQTRVIFREYPN